MAYVKEQGEASTRVVRPLGLYFWSGVWTLVAWCEMREDFRVFRVDRISDEVVGEATFTQKRGQRLADYLKTVRREKLE
jgi:predicted DNA-binding transcriptional regulator YafY